MLIGFRETLVGKSFLYEISLNLENVQTSMLMHHEQDGGVFAIILSVLLGVFLFVEQH